MRTRHAGLVRGLGGRFETLLTALFGVVVMLAGLGFVLAPSSASAAPPAQGWTSTQAPLPADAGNGSTNPDVYLASSTCPVANGCVTVGWYHDDATPQQVWGLIEQQNGTSWTQTEAPQPSDSGTGTNQGLWLGSEQCGYDLPCRAVSCPSTTSCVAVGSYWDTNGYTEPVVETYANGSWTAAKAPLPADAAGDTPSPTTNGYLFSVSCASTTSCVAVGGYRNTSNDFNGYIATLSGSTWSAVSAPLPAGGVTTTSQNPPPLTGVSCASASFCAASGLYRTSGGVRPLLEVLSNGSWNAVAAPMPADAGAAGTMFLAQVVCPTTTSCTAAGLYNDTTGHSHSLIDSWNGSTWSAPSVPAPAGVIDASLGAISCPSPTFCAAVGQDYDGTSNFGLIVTLSGGSWTAAQTPLPGPNHTPTANSFLWEIACPAPGNCLSAGDYQDSSGHFVSITVNLSGGLWAATNTVLPNTANTSSPDSLGRTVACYSRVACVLGGQFHDTSNNTQGFLATWTGAQGYWLDASDGGIFTYPNNVFYGSTGGLRLNMPMVGMAATPDAQGYWLVASDGGIFSYGDATFHGSRGGQPLNKPIVGMATTPDGAGYWLVASDGGIFGYGDAGFFGSRGGQPLNKPIVGMAATADGKGYWLVASDGGIFSYGDAAFYGSTGSLVLNKPVVGMASTPTGLGYWLVASDGGIFNYGDAAFYGSTGSIVLNKPMVGMAGSPSGKGYWLVASDGGIFNYGDAPFQGSAGALHLNAPVVGMAGG
jgi:hypothetical protein